MCDFGKTTTGEMFENLEYDDTKTKQQRQQTMEGYLGELGSSLRIATFVSRQPAFSEQKARLTSARIAGATTVVVMTRISLLHLRFAGERAAKPLR